jgi:hypothetical protein
LQEDVVLARKMLKKAPNNKQAADADGEEDVDGEEM